MPITVELPTAKDVLLRALDLIRSPLPHKWAACEFDLGPYCTRCASAKATALLVKEMELWFDAGDGALEWAALQLSIAGDDGKRPLTQAEAEAVIERAIARTE